MIIVQKDIYSTVRILFIVKKCLKLIKIVFNNLIYYIHIKNNISFKNLFIDKKNKIKDTLL